MLAGLRACRLALPPECECVCLCLCVCKSTNERVWMWPLASVCIPPSLTLNSSWGLTQPGSSSSHFAPACQPTGQSTNRPTPPPPCPVSKPHGVVGVGEREWGNFLSLLWIITVPQSTDNLSYLSNAVFQSYIYMLCGIWPASILLNKVLRLSKKTKTNSLIWFNCWNEMKCIKSFCFSYILHIVC